MTGPTVAQMRSRLAGVMPYLGPRGRSIIALRWGLGGSAGATLERAGELHGMSRERVRQIEGRILELYGISSRVNPRRRPYRTSLEELLGESVRTIDPGPLFTGNPFTTSLNRVSLRERRPC